MSNSIVRTETPEEREYARYLAEIEVRKRRVAGLQADLAAYKDQLSRFNAEYYAHIGVLFVELDRIELAIDEYKFRIAQLSQNSNIHPQDLEEQTKQAFADKREQIHDDEEETRYYEREHREEQKRPELDDASAATLRMLYLELVKRFHPDLSKTEDERLQREMVMKKVNAAFRERDIDRLGALGDEHHVDETAFESKSIGEKLVWAIREISRLDEIIDSVTIEKRELESTALAVLWARQEAGENVLEQLELELRSRMRARREHLQTLIDKFRTVVNEMHHD